jgi:hypothetical protein
MSYRRKHFVEIDSVHLMKPFPEPSSCESGWKTGRTIDLASRTPFYSKTSHVFRSSNDFPNIASIRFTEFLDSGDLPATQAIRWISDLEGSFEEFQGPRERATQVV